MTKVNINDIAKRLVSEVDRSRVDGTTPCEVQDSDAAKTGTSSSNAARSIVPEEGIRRC